MTLSEYELVWVITILKELGRDSAQSVEYSTMMAMVKGATIFCSELSISFYDKTTKLRPVAMDIRVGGRCTRSSAPLARKKTFAQHFVDERKASISTSSTGVNTLHFAQMAASSSAPLRWLPSGAAFLLVHPRAQTFAIGVSWALPNRGERNSMYVHILGSGEPCGTLSCPRGLVRRRVCLPLSSSLV